jgi:hypothetical protein
MYTGSVPGTPAQGSVAVPMTFESRRPRLRGGKFFGGGWLGWVGGRGWWAGGGCRVVAVWWQASRPTCRPPSRHPPVNYQHLERGAQRHIVKTEAVLGKRGVEGAVGAGHLQALLEAKPNLANVGLKGSVGCCRRSPPAGIEARHVTQPDPWPLPHSAPGPQLHETKCSPTPAPARNQASAQCAASIDSLQADRQPASRSTACKQIDSLQADRQTASRSTVKPGPRGLAGLTHLVPIGPAEHLDHGDWQVKLPQRVPLA